MVIAVALPPIVGSTDILQGVRYVITLDADTQLPRDSARLMVGTLAHRLNRPVVDAQKRRVVDGYTILQPRVGVSLPTADRSRYVELYSDDPGVDPYTRVVSDVYQDLFGEGSFIGKGIYDVDSFEQQCGDFPDNTILSHDLIEGAYCRSALLSDVTLYEEHPSRYTVDMGRRHRWMRGDWQIAGWLAPWVIGHSGQRVRNPISALSRWKIFDNLRRSLVPVAMLLVLLGSWFVAPGAVGPGLAFAALVFLLSIVLVPTFVGFLTDLLRKPVDLPLWMHVRVALQALGRPLAQNVLSLIFLPQEAYSCCDAIVRTVFRMLWSRRRLLEWRTASDAERGATGTLRSTIRLLAFAPAGALIAGIAIFTFQPQSLPFAPPWLVWWLLSPLVAWGISSPIPKRKVQLSERQLQFLAILSRKTWRYFEEFVTASDHWLPPDNVQLNPALVVASRHQPDEYRHGDSSRFGCL